jgi:hypothetical protein
MMYCSSQRTCDGPDSSHMDSSGWYMTDATAAVAAGERGVLGTRAIKWGVGMLQLEYP